MATREDTIRATVRALRARPPAGLDTCYVDGSEIKVVEDDEHAHRTYSVAVKPNPSHLDRSGAVWVPEPGSVAAAVIAEYARQSLRLEAAEARVRAATVGTSADQGRPVVLAVQGQPDGSIRVTLGQPWTAKQLDARRKLEKRRAAERELEELAAGPQPAETTVIVQLDETGCVCLDSLPEAAADRAAVLEALADDTDPPADGNEQDAIGRILGDPPPEEAP